MNRLNRFFLISIVLAVLAGRTRAWSQQAHSVVESEPNNTPATANAAALGDTLTGSISSVSDVDFFVVDIPAGSYMRIPEMLQVCLLDPDGVTLLQCNGGEYGTLQYPLTTTGRYYLRIRAGPAHTGKVPIGPYWIAIQPESFSLEAGDPPRTVVRLDAGFDRIVAGLHGELYVATSDRVLRISPTGDTTTLGSGLYVRGNLVVDAFGDVVLGNGWDLWKMSPDGTLSQFPADVTIPQFSGAALAVGPNGDLWVGTNEGITRLDPTGAKEAEIPLQAAHGLAVGPSGELYVAGDGEGCTVYVVVGADVECTLPDTSAARFEPPLELAIGQDGALYVGYSDALGEGGSGHVDVFPSGSKTSRLYAHVPGLQALTFGRDTQGKTTSRLLASEIGLPTRIVELNGANDRAVGAGLAVRFFHATLDTLPIASMGTAYNQTLHVTTDATALTWTVANGALPPGVTLSTSGVLQGTPTTTGSFAFTVRATSGERSWFAPGTIEVLPEVTVAQVTAALLGSFSLDPLMIEFLDQLGNKNGMLDVGDLRAFLRARGQLPPH